jgi:flagellar hook-basal body complex protein FliE
MTPVISPLGAKALESFGQGVGTFLGNTAQASTGVGASFANMLGQAATSVVENLQSSERLSAQALQGRGDMRSVVDSVMSAEQSLQAAVAIRDKIVSAYLEISRMAI